MDHLADSVNVAVETLLGAFQTHLAEVDRISQKAAGLLDPLSVTAVLQFNAFGAQKVAEVFVEFFLIDRLHIGSVCWVTMRQNRPESNYRAPVGL